MKKVAVIDPVGVKGGMQYYNIGLLKGLVEHGVEGLYFSNDDQVPEQIRNFQVFDGFVKNPIVKGLRQISSHWKAFRICKKEKVDAVVFHVFSSALHFVAFVILAKLFRLKTVLVSHDVVSFAGDDNLFLKRLMYNHLSDHLIVHNQYSLDHLSKIMTKTDEVSVIPHGGFLDLVDPKVSRGQAREDLGFTDDKTYLLFFGKIKKVKRLDVLIKAMPLVDESVELVIAGYEWKEAYEKYKQMIADLGVGHRVHEYVRYIEEDERERFMKACDVMVLPYENIFQSGVMLMGMSYGLAIVSSDVYAFREVVEHGKNGLLFSSLDERSLAKQLNSLVKDDELMKRLKEGALSCVKEKYSWSNIAASYKKSLNL
jgi:D-inositol-3-phosphate glycosyltransferase